MFKFVDVKESLEKPELLANADGAAEVTESTLILYICRICHKFAFKSRIDLQKHVQSHEKYQTNPIHLASTAKVNDRVAVYFSLNQSEDCHSLHNNYSSDGKHFMCLL